MRKRIKQWVMFDRRITRLLVRHLKHRLIFEDNSDVLLYRECHLWQDTNDPEAPTAMVRRDPKDGWASDKEVTQ